MEVIDKLQSGYDIVIFAVNAEIRKWGEPMMLVWASHIFDKSKKIIVNFSSPFYADSIFPEEPTIIDANNWLYTRIFVDGAELDLNTVEFSDFYREPDMKNGIMPRRFKALGVAFEFERFVSINHHYIGGQKIKMSSDKPHSIRIISGIDFTPIHEEEGKNIDKRNILCDNIGREGGSYVQSQSVQTRGWAYAGIPCRQRK